MKIAYIIQAHKDFNKISELVKALQGDLKEYIDIYIHIDLKSINLKESLLEFYKKDETVIILKNSISVNWGGLSQVKATILAMREIMDSGNNYKYISLLSGECYPLKTSKEIYNFLINSKYEYIEFEKNKKYDWRIEQYSLFMESKYNRKLGIRILNKILKNLQKFFFVKRKFFKEIENYKGSQWFTLSNKAISYILDETYSKNLIEKYQYTNCPDEHYFQNILLNSKFKNCIINDNLRYIEWEKGENSPKYFFKEEIKNIKTKKFFIRKIK